MSSEKRGEARAWQENPGYSGSAVNLRGRVLRRVEMGSTRIVPPAEGMSIAGARGLTEQGAEALAAELEMLEVEACTEGAARGFQQGLADGMSEAAEQMRSVLAAMETIRSGMEKSRASLLEALEEEITELALEIAEKLMLTELETNPDVTTALVRRVIERATERKGMRVRLNTRDYHTLVERKDELKASMVDLGDFEIVEDGSLERGDCVVETAGGIIDARLDRRLSRVRNSMMGKDETGS